jgi:hypothetical protein
MAQKDPFPNEWEDVFNINEEDFLTSTFDEVLEDSVLWDLPDPYCCIVRSYNRKESKLREYVYKQEGRATARINKLAGLGYELTILTQAYVGILNYTIND